MTPHASQRNFFYGVNLELSYSTPEFSQTRFGIEVRLFAVTDFKLGKFEINLGIGCGLTPGSDRLVAKTIIGYAFPVPGKNDGAGDRMPNRPPTPRLATHTSTGSAFAPDLFATR